MVDKHTHYVYGRQTHITYMVDKHTYYVYGRQTHILCIW